MKISWFIVGIQDCMNLLTADTLLSSQGSIFTQAECTCMQMDL